MGMRVYHYRSVNRALEEIKKGTFHYSSQDELNDPIEGYVKLYWQGDEAAWEGLFESYICSLYGMISWSQIGLSKDDLIRQAVIIDKHQWDDIPFGQDLKDVAKIFVNNLFVQKIVNWLGQQQIQCSVQHLGGIFKLINETAYILCVEHMKSKNLLPENYPDGNPKLFIDNIFARLTINDFNDLNKTKHSQMEQVAISIVQLLDYLDGQFEYIVMKNMPQEDGFLRYNMAYQLRFNFYAIYIQRLQEIVYPKGYVVCFSKKNNNSVMWGNYADNHKGVCLIYETISKDGKEVISVKNQMSFGSTGLTFSFCDAQLRPVQYGQPTIKRNFFESLGRLTMNQIESFVTTENKGSSKVLSTYFREEWRNQYWDDQLKKFHSKTASWEYEHEYRLFADAAFHEYTPTEQNIKYDPTCLKGVVFGIKTSIEDKAKVLQAFRDANIANVEVYQSRYNDDTQSIDVIQRYRF